VGELFKPTQTAPKTTQTDPFSNMRGTANRAEAILGGNLGGGGASFGSPYVGPSARQTGELNNMQRYLEQGRPLFRQGVGELQRTAEGAYLDPTTTSQYQNYRTSQQNLGNLLFSDAANTLNSRAAARGSYSGSSRLKGLAGTAGEIGGQAGQQVAQAGWGQYGRERQAQEGAAATGMKLAPTLSSQVFGAEETLRSAQQEANIAQMRGQLEAMGLDKAKVDTLLNYMGTAAGQAVPYVQGPSWMDRINASLGRWSPAGGAGGSVQPSSGGPTYQTLGSGSGGWGYM
jgi:hypothetical protein